jgi:hypothetical protein
MEADGGIGTFWNEQRSGSIMCWDRLDGCSAHGTVACLIGDDTSLFFIGKSSYL